MGTNNPYNPPLDSNNKVQSDLKGNRQYFSKTIRLTFLSAVIGGLSSRYFMSSHFDSIGSPGGRGIAFGVGGLIGVGVCLCIMFVVKLTRRQRQGDCAMLDNLE